MSAEGVLGSTTPRIFTPPLAVGPPGPCGCGCALTPETSDGFDIDEYARDVLKFPLDPWQRWKVIHATERVGGALRFRKVLIIVARQNGKTTTPVILSVFWQFCDRIPLIVGTHTKIDYAKISWRKAVDLVQATRALDHRRGRRWTRESHSEVKSFTLDGCEYKISAANTKGGRGLPIPRIIVDELRTHDDYGAWGALESAGNAQQDFQMWALSNAGTDASVVLNDLQDMCREEIATGDTADTDTFLGEWSSPEDADPEDVHALAAANPNMNRRIPARTLLSLARNAKRVGGEALTTFRTEVMCIRVRAMAPAIDPALWQRQSQPGTLDNARSRLAVCVDVAPDGRHATLAVAAILEDGRARVEAAHAWDGETAQQDLARSLPGWVERLSPQVVGWFPNGPAAAVATSIAARDGAREWPPAGVRVEEIRGEVAAVCMGLESEVRGETLVHSGQALLDAQAEAAERLLRTNRTWVFARGDRGHVDAVYAAAGAVHLARTLPPPVTSGMLFPSES